MKTKATLSMLILALVNSGPLGSQGAAADGLATSRLHGEIRDADSGELIPARLYLMSNGSCRFVHSASNVGSAIRYDKQRGESIERHTSLSAHPFVADLPPGRYTLTVERGKEYLPHTETITMGNAPRKATIRLKRWINMAERGWYSGDTHVHRALAELPNVMLAEDLNVALPLTGWVRDAFQSPRESYRLETGRVERELMVIDDTHVIHPLNTEWEIFNVGENRHTLGAVFALGQKAPIDLGAPPVRPIAVEARRQGALLELDKHNWPWSMMLVPVMEVDLFELSNNHVWRTQFHFTQFNNHFVPPPMRRLLEQGHFSEASWIEFGFQTYYTLLNCGFRLRPTAGAASGVHPVPLGFGRVYVHLPDGFSYEHWMQGLNAGRSFVTTGPMLLVTANEQPPGHVTSAKAPFECEFAGSAESAYPLSRIELVRNGELVQSIAPRNAKRPDGGRSSRFSTRLSIEESCWVVVRCYETTPEGRERFAHSSPFHFEIAGRPLRPRREDTAYLIKRIEDELARHKDVLPPAALDEYRQALDVYKRLDANAK